MKRHILVSHFGLLASLVWAKLILGRFRDAVLPDFSQFPAGWFRRLLKRFFH